MSAIIPQSRPQWRRERVIQCLTEHGSTGDVALLGVRGYYRDTMGVKGKNDFGLYDDAIFLVGKSFFSSFNANTDPGRDGVNPKIGKPYAVLKPGNWKYRLGMHKSSYMALVQADEVTVLRGETKEETGWFGINIHKGSLNSTSSEGCQTIYPLQWPAFIAAVQAEMKQSGAKTIHYVLMEGQG